ncbi:hypothetical protein [Mesorhizobium sp. SP-1A]|uniref:hypothetical protein n=1 Tax=Mesorhizobium sp. SP-1A TaxID=3077840 RepID=UPI0028F71E4E|nr:hypothetical protein [Mesorhizobium sp. SP-1A]
MKFPARTLLACCIAGTAIPAHADESAFLQFFNGKFTGKGSVQVTTSAPSVNVSCNFNSGSTSNSLSLDGSCRGLVVFSRQIAARLKVDGSRYSGTYIGSRTGPAGLSGSRRGNAINLTIRWAKEVNGDRKAQLTVQKIGSRGMRLTVTDFDPAKKRNVVTSRIDLNRV